MSNKNVYVGTGKARINNFGNEEIKVSLSPDDIITLNNSIGSGGWINLVITPRKEVNEKGVSHSVLVDTWEPNKPQAQQAPVQQQAQTEASTPDFSTDLEDDDSIPF